MEMHVKQLPIACLCGLALSCAALPAHAVDGIAFEAGFGSRVQLARGSLLWNFRKALHESDNLAIRGYWDLNLSHWRGTRYNDQPGQHQNLNEVGITPMFRFQKPGSKFYGEAGIGAHVLSGLYNNNGDRLSTAFEFGSKLGIGYVFSPRASVGLSIQHYSNGGIKHPNSGVDFVSMKVSYFFP
jgi:hypothetical protein